MNEQYLQMSLKARVLQNTFKKEVKDTGKSSVSFIADVGDGNDTPKVFVRSKYDAGVDGGFIKGDKKVPLSKARWIPTQEELQILCGSEDMAAFFIIGLHSFYDVWYKPQLKNSDPVVFKSMEEFTLGYYMYFKHRKIWTGTKWVDKD